MLSSGVASATSVEVTQNRVEYLATHSDLSENEQTIYRYLSNVIHDSIRVDLQSLGTVRLIAEDYAHGNTCFLHSAGSARFNEYRNDLFGAVIDTEEKVMHFNAFLEAAGISLSQLSDVRFCR